MLQFVSCTLAHVKVIQDLTVSDPYVAPSLLSRVNCAHFMGSEWQTRFLEFYAKPVGQVSDTDRDLLDLHSDIDQEGSLPTRFYQQVFPVGVRTVPGVSDSDLTRVAPLSQTFTLSDLHHVYGS